MNVYKMNARRALGGVPRATAMRLDESPQRAASTGPVVIVPPDPDVGRKADTATLKTEDKLRILKLADNCIAVVAWESCFAPHDVATPIYLPLRLRYTSIP